MIKTKKKYNDFLSLRTIVLVVLYFSFLWYASKFSLQAFGERPRPVQILSLCVFASIFCAYSKTFWYFVFPAAVIVGIYGPIGFEYGKPSYQFVISLFATTFNEASEFLSQFSIRCLLKGLSIPVLVLLSHITAKRAFIHPWRNKTYVFVSLAILICFGRPTPFFDTLKTAFMQVEEENEELQKLMSKNAWKAVTTKSLPKDYILVIGESVRLDYLQLYGYPVDNTPFLSSSRQVTAVKGLVSAAHFTAGSLRLMLTDPDITEKEWKARYDHNLIGLTKDAGFRTVWFSNQGYSGIDTPVTAIAKNAEKTIFVTGGGYTASNASDFVLLPMIQSELSKHVSGPRFIVLHTIGSHKRACKRVTDMPYVYEASDNSYKNLACYVSSIRKTDQFLEKLTDILTKHSQQTGRPYSIIWFSDHGQTQITEDGKYMMQHGDKTRSNFEVPLVKIDSDTTSPVKIRSFKSGLRFTCGLAGWMQIEADGLPRCNLFDGKDDEDSQLKEFFERKEEEPPINLDLTWQKVK